MDEKEQKLMQLLDAELDDESRKNILDMLENNPALKENKIMYEKIISGIQFQGEKDLRIDLAHFLNEQIEIDKNETGNSKNWRSYYLTGIAASFLLLIGFYFSYVDVDSGKDPMNLQMNKTPINAQLDSLNIDSLLNSTDSIKINGQ